MKKRSLKHVISKSVHYWLIGCMISLPVNSVNGSHGNQSAPVLPPGQGGTGYFQWRRVATKLGIE